MASSKIYIVQVRGYVYSKELQFLIYIQYKISLRKLQEASIEKDKCIQILGEY